MKKLFLELSFAALCTALLSACGGDSGSSADSLDESSSSSEMDGAESSDSEDLNSNGSEGSEGNSSGSEGGESSGSGEDDGESSTSEDGESSSSVKPAYAVAAEADLPLCNPRREGMVIYVEETDLLAVCESGTWHVMDADEGTSSDSSEGNSSGSEGGESSGSGEGNSSSSSEGVEGSSASVPGGSSDSSVYDADKNTLTDLRDGQTYRTVKIGDQVWMAKNLNYAYTGVPFDNGYYTSDSTSWCYDNDPANCAKYGRLYTWVAAMDSVGEWSTSGKGCGYGENCSVASAGSATLVRGVCPKGWHLPSHDEWEALFKAVRGSSTAGSMLKSATGWRSSGNGTDTFGFSALPAGIRYSLGDYNSEGYGAYFWSSTEYNSYAYYMNLPYSGNAVLDRNEDKNDGFSVRCLKD